MQTAKHADSSQRRSGWAIFGAGSGSRLERGFNKNSHSGINSSVLARLQRDSRQIGRPGITQKNYFNFLLQLGLAHNLQSFLCVW